MTQPPYADLPPSPKPAPNLLLILVLLAVFCVIIPLLISGLAGAYMYNNYPRDKASSSRPASPPDL